VKAEIVAIGGRIRERSRDKWTLIMVSCVTTAYILAKELFAREAALAQHYCRMQTYPPVYFVIRLDLS